MTYDSGRYSSTFENEDGLNIWEFLTRAENVIRMETAAFLSRPAIEPMSPLLVEEFGSKIEGDRIKQMMGHMVRQIMEQRGYELQQANVKITSNGNIFSRASRYALKQSAID